MSASRPQKRVWLAAAVVVALAAVELLVKRAPDATLLVALTYFTMMVQGCVALAATGELTKGMWLAPVRRHLFAVYPLLLVVPLLSLLLGFKMEIYPWAAHPTAWLNERFFLIRNLIVHAAVFAAAARLVAAVRRESDAKNRWAGSYIALFIVSQSFVAFDWIMSLEYPWISTLLGGFFFIESFLMALAVVIFVLLFRARGAGHGLTETLRDAAKMMFGFSVMWVGFFFAQFLVIWYGNIPEEVGVLLERLRRPPYAGMSRAVIITVWAIPFVVLLSRPLKTVPPVMAGVAFLILGGLFVEKLVLVMPVAAVNPAALAAETALLLALVAAYASGPDPIAGTTVTSSAEAPPQAR